MILNKKIPKCIIIVLIVLSFINNFSLFCLEPKESDNKIQKIREDLNIVLRKQLSIIKKNNYEVRMINLTNINEHYIEFGCRHFPNIGNIKGCIPITIFFTNSNEEEGSLTTFYSSENEDNALLESYYNENDGNLLFFNNSLIHFEARGKLNKLIPKKKEIMFNVFRDDLYAAELEELPDIFTKFIDIYSLFGLESNINNSKENFPIVSNLFFVNNTVVLNFNFINTSSRINKVIYRECTQKQQNKISRYKNLFKIEIPHLKGHIFEREEDPETGDNPRKTEFEHGAFFKVDKMLFEIALPMTKESISNQQIESWTQDITVLMNLIIPNLDPKQLHDTIDKK